MNVDNISKYTGVSTVIGTILLVILVFSVSLFLMNFVINYSESQQEDLISASVDITEGEEETQIFVESIRFADELHVYIDDIKVTDSSSKLTSAGESLSITHNEDSRVDIHAVRINEYNETTNRKVVESFITTIDNGSPSVTDSNIYSQSSTYTIEDIDNPDVIQERDRMDVSYKITNEGETTGEQEIRFYIDDETISQDTVSLEPDESEILTNTYESEIGDADEISILIQTDNDIMEETTLVEEYKFDEIGIHGEISNWYEFNDIRNNTERDDLELVNNLNDETEGYDVIIEDNDGFEPIQQFTGTLTGNDYTISDLYIDSHNYSGIFMSVEDGEFSNIKFDNTEIEGNEFVGVIAGESQDSAYYNIHISGTVTGDTYIGGLVGESRNDTISVSSSTGTKSAINSDGVSGGLASVSNGSDITNSYSHSDVNSHVSGGLIGYNTSQGTVSNSFATGDITGNFDGGLVGQNEGLIEDSYWDTESTTQSEASGNNDGIIRNTEGLSTTEMKGENADTVMTEFDFETIWKTQENNYIKHQK